MQRLIDAAAQHPVFANLAMVTVIAGGTWCYTQLTAEITPEFSVNRIQIVKPYPAAAPEEVEEGICVKIEEAVDGVVGVKNVDSVAREGLGTVTLELEEQVGNVSEVLNEVRDRVDAIDTFPEESEAHHISEVRLRRPVLLIVLHGQASERVLHETARDLKDEFMLLDGVSQVELSGIRDYEISIEVGEATLRKYNLTLEQIAAKVRQASQDISGGNVRTRHEDFKIEVQGRRYRGREYRDIEMVPQPDGSSVTLGQIANIEDTFVEDEVRGRFNGEPAVLLRVMRTSDQDTIQIARRVQARLDELRPALPGGTKLSLMGDFSLLIVDRIELLVKNGLQGLLLVFLCLWLFINLRLSFWVTMGIPFTFAFAGIVMLQSGQTVNMLSLFGLIIVLGLVVDDAIVVGENISVHQDGVSPPLDGAVRGANEVAWPVVATVATTIVAFAPMFAVSGMMGKFIAEVPPVVIAVLAASLFESLFILPAHLSHAQAATRTALPAWMGRFGAWRARIRKRLDAGLEFVIERLYAPVYRAALAARFATLALACACMILCAGMLAGGLVPFDLFPAADSEYLNAEILFPEGTGIEITAAAVERLERAILALNEKLAERVQAPAERLVLGVYSDAGGGEGLSHRGSLYVQLVGPELRRVHSEDVVRAWRKEAGTIPGAISLTAGAFGGPGLGGADIEAYLKGKDYKDLRTASVLFREKLSQYDGAYEVQDDFQPGKRELLVTLKPEGQRLGMTVADLARQLRAGYFGAEALRLQRGREEVKVRVRFPREERASLEQLERLRVRTPGGREVAFGEVAALAWERGLAQVKRRNGRRSIAVTAKVDKSITTSEEVLRDLRSPRVPPAQAGAAGGEGGASFLETLRRRAPGVEVSFEGQNRERIESVRSLQKGFLFAALAIYAIIALTFRSYLQPLIVMLTIPLGAVGAIVGHFTMGYMLTMLSTFGLVALSGVVVNDAIVMIEFINQRQREGRPVLEALAMAGPRRFRAVMLTTLTTVAGLSPLLMERSFQAQFLLPMAISLAAGLVFATLLTLFVVPSLYLILNDLRRMTFWLRTGLWPTREAVEPAHRQRKFAEALEQASPPRPVITHD